MINLLYTYVAFSCNLFMIHKELSFFYIRMFYKCSKTVTCHYDTLGFFSVPILCRAIIQCFLTKLGICIAYQLSWCLWLI